MSDRVVLLDAGVPIQVASPNVIYRDPADLRVARFVGTPRINVVPAIATASGIDVLGVKLPLSCGLPPGTKLQVGVRPESLAVARDGTGFSGRLVYQENLGADLHLHVAVAGAPEPVIARCDPNVGDGLAIGGELRLVIAPGRALLFDLRGGRVHPTQNGGVLA